ncbi:MAG TPA: M48 family metalloprotease, partial [Bryobacteraceae bacterium]|nr:M48 family metalloprotease [Bryobacteraceae bacterium]
MSQIRFVLILALLIAGVTLATRGAMDPTVSLESLTQLWSDTLRDTDQLGMKVTRVSDTEETAIGAELAQAFSGAQVDHADEAYVSAIGQAVARHARRGGIRYQFHLIDSPMVNAFALPGGQIFVTTGMLGFVESEAELAAILGH